MIIRDESVELPAEWTNQLCDELVAHAIDLGHYGNPAGFLLTVCLHPYIGYDEGDRHYLRGEWDYDGMRVWISENLERVKRVWQLQVKLI